MSGFGSLKRNTFIHGSGQQRHKTVESATALSKLNGAKVAVEDCNQNDLQHTPSDCIAAEAFSINSKPGPAPVSQSSHSSKSSLFTIANLLGSAACAQNGSTSTDINSSVVGAIISGSPREAAKTVVTSEQEKIVSANGTNSVAIGCEHSEEFGLTQGEQGKGQPDAAIQSGAMEKADTDARRIAVCYSNESLGRCSSPTVVGGGKIADSKGTNSEATGGSAGATGEVNQVLKSQREKEGTNSLSTVASHSSHVTKKPRLLGILRNGRQKRTFPKSQRCRRIEEVLSKRLSHSLPQQVGEGDGGGRQKEDELDDGGSSTQEDSSGREGRERGSVSFAHCLASDHSGKVVPTQSSTINLPCTDPDSDVIHLTTNSNKSTPSTQTDLKVDEPNSSQPLDSAVSKAARSNCHQSCNKPGTSAEVGGQQQEGHTSEVVVLQAGSRTDMPTSSVLSGMSSVKISTPEQGLTRILSPLVMHSYRPSVTPTVPSCHPKEEDCSPPKKIKQNDTAGVLAESALATAYSQPPATSFQSPFLYAAVPHPWTPSMEWQLPSILSMMMTPSPSQFVQRRSENGPPDSLLPEQPKWMWGDPFGGHSISSVGAPSLPSSLFSPQQLFSQPMSPFSPSQLLNLPIQKIDTFPVAPLAASSSGSDGGGGEGGSLEENPFKGMHRCGMEKEGDALSGVPLSGAGEEPEGAQAPKRPRLARRSQDADLVHGSSSSSSLHQSIPVTHPTSMDATQQSTLPHCSSQRPPQVFPSACTRMPSVPVIVSGIPTCCPAPNDSTPAHFCHPPPTQTPRSPPSWQMLLTQMNGLLQLQNIQRNMEAHKQNLSVHCLPYDTSVAMPAGDHGHPSSVYPMMHQPNMPFLGYSGTAFENTFLSGCGQYKSDPLNTGISHFPHLSDPTAHHASCKDGYCHHIEEHIKKAKKQRKKKSSAKQEDRESKGTGAVANCRQDLRQVIQEAIKTSGRTAKASRFSSPSKLRRHMVEQARSFLHRYQRVVTHQHTF